MDTSTPTTIACGAVALFWTIALGYVVGSFAIMRAHTEPRPFWAVVRAGLVELLWVALVVPLVPLFYVIGRRMARGGPGVPVVVVHGYTQNRANFLRIARALGKAGSGPVYGFNYNWLGPIDRSAARLARFVDEVCTETGATQVDLVAHSLGGLVSLEFVRAGGAARVRRVVTVASPHGGVAWRGPILGSCGPQIRQGSKFLEAHGGPLAVPCLSIYSRHDNIVHPPSTSALAHRGGLDLAVDEVPHLTILFAKQVVSAVVDFVGQGESRRSRDGAATSSHSCPNPS